MKRIIGLLVLAVALAGCAYKVDLTPPAGGATGQGEVTRYGHSGKMTVELAGRRYVGKWAYDPIDAQVEVAYPTTVEESERGNGHARLRSADGKTLECAFRFNSSSNKSIGKCRAQDGAVYDLFIQRS